MPFSILEPTKVLMGDSIQEEGCVLIAQRSRRSLKEKPSSYLFICTSFPEKKTTVQHKQNNSTQGGVRYTEMGALALKIQ